MERHEILQMMATLQLSGMRAAYDEIVQTGVKRQHSFERIHAAFSVQPMLRLPVGGGVSASFA